MINRVFRRSTFFALALLASGAQAKVTFTGYGQAIAAIDSKFSVRGPAAVLGATPESNVISRGFRLDAFGLFATTKVNETTDFVVDLTFRNIGSTVRETRIQYAYLDASLPWWELNVKAGRVTLPFGYYNTRRFYPFQRVELSAPIFVNSILGLPIADAGLVIARRFPIGGDWGVDAQVYGVNGYGNVAGSTGSLRNPAVPGGIGMTPNLTAGNNNKDIAVGGQLALGKEAVGEVGVSYYRGAWDTTGRRLLQMAGAHAHWTPGEFDFLAEYLHIHATGDQGVNAAFGSTSWVTHGAFATVSHPLFTAKGRKVVGYARGENYHTARQGGGPGREVLRGAAGGLTSRLDDNIMVKLESQYLFYAMPFTTQKSLVLDGRIFQAALVVTF